MRTESGSRRRHRDYLAGQALVGIAQHISFLLSSDTRATHEEIDTAIEAAGVLAYRLADAALAAKESKS